MARFPGTHVYPIFSIFYYGRVSDDPFWGTIENFVIHNLSFRHDLSQIEPSLFRDSLTFFPTLSERELLGCIRWLVQFKDIERPKAVVCLTGKGDWSDSGFSNRVYPTIWANCPEAGKKDLVLTVRSTRICQ